LTHITLHASAPIIVRSSITGNPQKEATMRTLPLTLATLLLAACSTPQERAAHMQAQADEMVTIYGPACMRLGYAANTDQWRACILNLSAKEDLRSSLSYPSFYGGGYWNHGYWGPY
jgi:uncharacterized lipoprotein YajG